MLKDVSNLVFKVEASNLLIKALKFIILTGLNEEKIAISSVKMGIQDYLVKDHFDSVLLARSIQYAIERKQMETNLKESEKRYKDLIETSSMGLLEIDLINKNIEYINPKLLKIFGYKRTELNNASILYKTIFPEDIKEILESHVEKKIEFRVITKNGKIKWLSGNRLHHYNENGEITALRLWLMDITEKKELEEIKNNLVTRFSHEFKTPLISIKGFADFLLTVHNKNLDDKTISFLKKIKDGGNRLKELVNSFIESSQLDNALTKLKLHQENLTDLIKTGLEEMQGLINLRDHTIDIHDQLIASVDKEKIYSVITNLLLNAINYTPKGGKIWIQSIVNEGSIIVSVKDNGIGLDDIDKKQLFKPFGKIERYGKGWDIVSEGMGMGLYLSKEIMNLHGGKIGAESKGRNKGTTFYFSFPIVTN
jgi:PAS domain S-box-containing protein